MSPDKAWTSFSQEKPCSPAFRPGITHSEQARALSASLKKDSCVCVQISRGIGVPPARWVWGFISHSYRVATSERVSNIEVTPVAKEMRIDYCKSVLGKRAPLGRCSDRVVTCWSTRLAAGQSPGLRGCVLSAFQVLDPKRLLAREASDLVGVPGLLRGPARALPGPHRKQCLWGSVGLRFPCCRCNLCHGFHWCPSPPSPAGFLRAFRSCGL